MRPVDNPPNPFLSEHVEWLGEPPVARLQVHEEQAKSILSENSSPDIPFRYSLNPYRGCYHGCAYCYARPSHQYLGWGAGSDFERQLVVKLNAAQLLRKRLASPRWRREAIALSGNTDCYQPLEAAYHLTRACLEVCLEYETPVAIITKSALVMRDLDLLADLSRHAGLRVFISIAFADDETGRAMEPGASLISRRLHALEKLSAAGIETGVAVAPIITGLNDRQIGTILSRAAAAGAKHAFRTALRLPAEVAPVFELRLRRSLPQAADRVMAGIRQVRGGKLNDARFGNRMTGQGPRWKALEDLFELHAARVGLNTRRVSLPSLMPSAGPRRGQLSLFGSARGSEDGADGQAQDEVDRVD